MRNPSDDDSLLELSAALPTEQRSADEDWNPQLAEALYASLGRWMGSNGDPFGTELEALEDRFGDAVYSEAIFALSHLRMPPPEARRCWREIADLRETMRRKLGSFVDMRVALAAYFLQVNQKLHNPKIIEMQLFERTRAFAYRDDLTGLYNHRFFEESLAQEILRSERSGLPVSLAILDVDDFKKINDVLGHEGGNEVLARVAVLLTKSSRGEDILARYGGEEFAVILPATRKTEAFELADRARIAIEEGGFKPRGPECPSRLTASIGIATYPGDATQASFLIRCADRALYAAKAAGKNQVQLYDCSRRSFPRVHVTLEGTFRAIGHTVHKMKTLDVSDGGLLFACNESLPVSTLVEFGIDLPDGAGRVPGVGRVVYAAERSDGSHEIAVRMVGIEPGDRQRLSRFVTQLRPEEHEDSGTD